MEDLDYIRALLNIDKNIHPLSMVDSLSKETLVKAMTAIILRAKEN